MGFKTRKIDDAFPFVEVLGYEPDGGETELILPQYTHSIGDGAFKDCTSITSVKLPKTLTTIGREAFKACTSLKEVIMPEGDAPCDISFGAFADCTSLERIDLPSAHIIADTAFQNCNKLKEINVGNSLDITRYTRVILLSSVVCCLSTEVTTKT